MRKQPKLNDGTESIDEIQAQLKAKKRLARRKKRRKFLRRLLVVLLLVGLGYGFYSYDKTEYSRIKNIKIHGNAAYSDEEILALTKLHLGERIYLKLPFLLENSLHTTHGIASSDVNVYYTKGLVTLQINEMKRIGYRLEPRQEMIFEDGSFKEILENQEDLLIGLPLFVGFQEAVLPPGLSEALTGIDSASFAAISEIHVEPNEFDKTALRLVMNNNTYVFTSIKTLPLLTNYATIVSEADADKKCIYFLAESGNPIAVARSCPLGD